MIFRQVQASRWIIALRPIFFYYSWQLMLWLLWTCRLGVTLPSFYIQGGRGYKESLLVGYNLWGLFRRHLFVIWAYVDPL
jgi:hypothetical protein